jgi:hypothetical protein
MGRLLYISECKRRIAAKKGFTPWVRRFGISFDDSTSIRRLDNPIIKYLVQGNDDSSSAFYELIMGIKGLGLAPRFHYLDSESKMNVTDITLFLLDIVRFEAMYRLGWLDDYPFLQVPLIDLIQSFHEQFSAARHNSPALSSAHPLYEEYVAEFEGDRHALIRKLIPEAIKVFCDLEDDAGT